MMFFSKNNKNGEKKYYFSEKVREKLIKNAKKCIVFGSFAYSLGSFLDLLLKGG